VTCSLGSPCRWTGGTGTLLLPGRAEQEPSKIVRTSAPKARSVGPHGLAGAHKGIRVVGTQLGSESINAASFVITSVLP
jgi:hypothetical protein